jgi:hypothetical protein
VEFFVLVAQPASAYVDQCNTWDIVASSAPLLAAVETALASCGATRMGRDTEGSTMNHPYFGTIDPTKGGDWSGDVQVGGRSVPVDMTRNGPTAPSLLDAAAAFARDASRFDKIAREALVSDSADDSSVVQYVDHHLTVLKPDALNAAFGTSAAADISRAQFLDRMILKWIGLYPESPTELAVFDYTLDGHVTDYVLCVSFDANGAVTGVDMES